MTEITQDNIDLQIREVSHEIRNHLSICDMYSQIIKRNLEKEGIENSSISNALDCIQKSIQIISANVLDLRSMNSNCSEKMDFKTTVLRGAELAKAYITDKDITFDIFIKHTADICVDENRFISCIVNIIKNGIEAIEIRGKIKLYGEIKGNNAFLTISNDGKPIAQSKQSEIFANGFTTKQHGCGLGLFICKQYLESQHASIELVKSTCSQTTFEISIPIVK